MAYTIAATQPGPRAARLEEAERAPGLYDGETVYRLDEGDLVALAVEIRWKPSNEGVVIIGSARWVDETGQTYLYDGEHHVETTYRHLFSTLFVEKAGEKELAREIALLMLGEDATHGDVHVDPDAPTPEKVADGTALEPSNGRAPLLPVSDDVRRGASIRAAIANVRRSRPLDLTALL